MCLGYSREKKIRHYQTTMRWRRRGCCPWRRSLRTILELKKNTLSQFKKTFRRATSRNLVKKKYRAIAKWFDTYRTDLWSIPNSLIGTDGCTIRRQNTWDKVWTIRSTQAQTSCPLRLEFFSDSAKEESHAMAADVKEMYHMLRLPERDKSAVRFLCGESRLRKNQVYINLKE